MDEKTNKIKKLMELTGEGSIACDIALALAGGEVNAALERMKVSYPATVGARYAKQDSAASEPESAPDPVPEDRDKKPWE